MMHFIAILSVSTFISVMAYLVQHGEIQASKNFSKFPEYTTVQKAEIHPISYLQVN
jgi:hypothetical protein